MIGNPEFEMQVEIPELLLRRDVGSLARAVLHRAAVDLPLINRAVRHRHAPAGEVTAIKQFNRLLFDPFSVVHVADLRSVGAAKCAGRFSGHGEVARQFASFYAGAVDARLRGALELPAQLIAVKRDLRNRVQLAAWRADKLALRLRGAGPGNLEPPDPAARVALHVEYPAAVKVGCGGGQRGHSP